MFIPLFIALLLGLVNPSHTNSNSGGDTVYVNAAEPDPNDPGTDPCIDPEGNLCTDPGFNGPGGDNGHVHPPRPKPKP